MSTYTYTNYSLMYVEGIALLNTILENNHNIDYVHEDPFPERCFNYGYTGNAVIVYNKYAERCVRIVFSANTIGRGKSSARYKKAEASLREILQVLKN